MLFHNKLLTITVAADMLCGTTSWSTPLAKKVDFEVLIGSKNPITCLQRYTTILVHSDILLKHPCSMTMEDGDPITPRNE